MKLLRSRPSLLRLSLAFACACCVPLSVSTTENRLTEVYLIQDSGWMEPFYADKTSQFRDVVAHLVDTTRLVGVPTVIASFDQDGQIVGHRSPKQVFAGLYDRNNVEEAIASILPPRRANGKYADSDFFGALKGAITSLLGGRQGIIWMVTNNKDSPNNDQKVLENTQKFYSDLRQSQFIRRIIAFPIRMPVHGPHYDEHGFIIYGIAYGATAARALSFLTSDGQPIRRLFTAPPVRLKPLDQDPLRLELSLQRTGGITADLEAGTLTIHDIPSSGARVTLSGRLINSYYPQEVTTAQLSSAVAAARTAPAPMVAQLNPISIRHLSPGAAIENVTIDLQFPRVPRGSIFKDYEEEDGYLLIRLANAKLTLSEDFVRRMKDVFGVDILMRDQAALRASGVPAVMFDYQRVNEATTAVPIRLIYKFSPWPLILAIVGGLIALAVLLGGAVLMLMPRKYTVTIGGSNIQVRLRPFEKRTVQTPTGARAVIRGAFVGKPAVRPLSEGSKPAT